MTPEYEIVFIFVEIDHIIYKMKDKYMNIKEKIVHCISFNNQNTYDMYCQKLSHTSRSVVTVYFTVRFLKC